MKRAAAILGFILWIAVIYFLNLSPTGQVQLLVDVGLVDPPTQVAEVIPWSGEPLVIPRGGPPVATQ